MSDISRRQFVKLAALIATSAYPGNLLAEPSPQPGEPEWIPSDPPNRPFGEAKGIFPGRVTWVRDVRATPWDGKTGKWWEEKNINQSVLDQMMARSLCGLTGAAE